MVPLPKREAGGIQDDLCAGGLSKPSSQEIIGEVGKIVSYDEPTVGSIDERVSFSAGAVHEVIRDQFHVTKVTARWLP
ncbi:hypothetical protein EVAR_2217_1 [Eumeta japonica]|uniref:Uncharacterized protein n=1 Tax=Eumeta variegata TaxID=151549 RepID=A0A4C1SG71_EUMVA|nr:hypothetical protein EVAR_2217_1 [Eumeta japonica]